MKSDFRTVPVGWRRANLESRDLPQLNIYMASEAAAADVE